MPTVIRPAEDQDASAWLRMRAALYEGEDLGFLEEEVRQIKATGRLKDQPFICLLALDEGTAVGFAEATIRSSAEDCATSPVVYLEGWYVELNARGTGVGRALADSVAQWGRGHGCREMASDTRVDNDDSARAHLALGFEDSGVIRCFSKSLD